jgi:glucokinase
MWQLCDNDLDNVTGITAFEAMRKGDPTAKQVVDKYIYYISVGIVDNIYVFQPEVICLGGGISGEGDSLIAPIIENVKNQIPSFNPQIDTKIKIAELGNDAGIIGAAYI